MQINLLKKGFAVGIILLFIGTTIIPSIAQNIEKSSSRGNWFYVGGSGPGNYSKIQDAINHASDGDTVYVFSGIYYENVRVNRSVNLTGENKNNTIVDGNFSRYCLFLESGHVRVSGFTLQNSGTHWYNDGGVSIKNILVNSHYNVIVGNIMKNNYYGIFAYASNGNFIANNLITNNKNDGIYFQGYDNYNNITMNTITNNAGNGIEIGADYALSCESNSISHNYIDHNNKSGIISYDYSEMIKDNFIGNSINGILVNANKCQILHNNISNNQLGLQVALCTQCVIQENNFINNSRAATFQYFIIERIMVPRFNAPQLTKWKGNYWDRHLIGPKVILGTMIFFAILALIFFNTLGIPWINYDFSPAMKPYNDAWGAMGT